MVGAVLTQNTAWSNVERAICNLKEAGFLDGQKMAKADPPLLAQLIRPSGYFNIKVKRLQNLCNALITAEALDSMSDEVLRKWLLDINGIGPETADDILLYAFERPFFVIDAYTRRLFFRFGLVSGDESYEVLRSEFEQTLGPDVELYNEYHALIVRHAKEACRTKPLCEICCLRRSCGWKDW
ncbi:MAG: endonuclease [Gammaproteobacteria bacterium (ex Lamellibrachia satsuma)]|nr:MAG: endonuclease [Gammaproteobacteria bacterium (ex Lamellibrachia satsuma)]